MSDTHSIIEQAIAARGAAAVARELGVSRAALLGYAAKASREGTRLLVEQRASRLVPTAGAR